MSLFYSTRKNLTSRVLWFSETQVLNKKGKPVQNVFLPSTLLQNPAQEPLKVILKPYSGITHVPAELGEGGPETLVFIELQKCFKKAGCVAEGMLANIIWGFEQCGYDPRAVASGITKLRSLGYVFFSDERGNIVHEQNFSPDKPIWIRYSDKFRTLLIRSIQTA